jgi:hypothetical protein
LAFGDVLVILRAPAAASKKTGRRHSARTAVNHPARRVSGAVWRISVEWKALVKTRQPGTRGVPINAQIAARSDGCIQLAPPRDILAAWSLTPLAETSGEFSLLASDERHSTDAVHLQPVCGGCSAARGNEGRWVHEIRRHVLGSHRDARENHMSSELKAVGAQGNTEYWTCGPDILVVVPAPGYKDTVELARANMEWQHAFARSLGRKCGLVVVMNNLLSQDAESRRVYSEGMLPELFYGSALVVGNPLSRAIGSFFIGLSKPAVPLTLVSSIEEGISWLQGIRNTP